MAKRKAPRKRPARKPENEKVQDGELTIHVQGGPHDGKAITMDAMLVKLTAETLERKHKLEVKDNRTIPTAAFAKELHEQLETLGYDSSPTIAIHAWSKACEYFVEVQKKTS